jgi:hypothetical protein
MPDPERLQRKSLSAGQEVDALCSRCALELAHVIVAMDGARIVRVQCKTCKTVHAYRRPGGAIARPAPGRPREGGRRDAEIGDRAFEQVMKGRDLSRAPAYLPSLQFGVNDIVSHATFGIGAVTKILADGKIEVAFRVGLKVLVHGRS